MIEFAIIAPVMLTILFGVIAYGSYFWVAHSLQQVANDAARATIAGLTSDERTTLAQSEVSSELPRIGGLQLANATTTVDTSNADLVTVRISYDASALAVMHLNFVPLPSSTIVRTSTIRVGGP